MKSLRFLVSLITDDNDYQIMQAEAAEEAAHRLHVDVNVIYAGNDSIRQSQQLLDVIQSRSSDTPDVVIVEPAGVTALPKVAQAATSSGIGWIVLNHEADYISDLRKRQHVPVCAVSADHKEVGRLQGRQFAALLPSGGTALYIQGPSGSSAVVQRTCGIYETKPHNLQLRILKAANWTEAAGYQVISSWLRLSTSHSQQIDLIGAQNDLIAHGARKAFAELTTGSERDKWLSLPFTGVDGLTKTGQFWVHKGVLVATIVVPPITTSAIELVVEANRSNSQPPEHTLVRPESFPAIALLSMKANR
jgi:ABC-type sugar transport system substrate-binding protein